MMATISRELRELADVSMRSQRSPISFIALGVIIWKPSFRIAVGQFSLGNFTEDLKLAPAKCRKAFCKLCKIKKGINYIIIFLLQLCNLQSCHLSQNHYLVCFLRCKLDHKLFHIHVRLFDRI